MTPRAAALAELLGEQRRKRVSLEELWGLFDRVSPESRASAQRRALLADAVAELVAAGVLAPWRSGDGGRPPLPLTVRRLEAPAVPSRRRRTAMWHPELRWADGIRLSESQAVLLEKVNRWLFDGGTASRPAPLRERAYEITRDEKAFEGGPLFGGRLTLEVLRAYRPKLPLPVVRLGDGPDLLVVENGDTFDPLRRTLVPASGPIGRLAWGAGAAFESSVLSLAETGDPPAAQASSRPGSPRSIGSRLQPCSRAATGSRRKPSGSPCWPRWTTGRPAELPIRQVEGAASRGRRASPDRCLRLHGRTRAAPRPHPVISPTARSRDRRLR